MDRYGKWLIFVLNDYYLLSHLRMEGKYFFKAKEEELSKHEHVVFTLDNKEELRYHDVRKFGKMWLIDKDKLFKRKISNEKITYKNCFIRSKYHNRNR